jgi:hypothetical protein
MGGGSDVRYAQSPEQREVYETITPVLKMLRNAAKAGTSPWDIPDMPSSQGVLTSAPMYNIPDIGSTMPSTDWWGGISPEIKAGLWAPYEEAGHQLIENMGFTSGSARGGYSGAAGAAMGELAAEAGKNVGLQAWEMTSPMMQREWEANLARNQTGYQNVLQENLMDYQGAMQARGELLQGYQAPYSILPGLTGGTYPNPVVTNGGSGIGDFLSPILAMGLGGYMSTK